MAASQARDVKKLSSELKKMKKELQQLRDRQGVVDAVNRYARGLDRHDYELFGSAFHPDAVDNHGDWVGYMPEFVPWGIDLHDKYASHSHNMTTHYAEIDGDEAHAESYVIYVLKLKDEHGAIIGGGRYLDRLERRKGQWRIILRRMVVDWRYVSLGGPPISVGIASIPGRWDKQDLAYMRPLRLSAELQKALDAKGRPAKA
jgi:hypothetical protein